MTPLVSIVLVTYNDERFLPEYFEKLDETTYSPWEQIVVDNGSTDSTLDLLRARGDRLTLLENTESRGFGAACNQGSQLARGEFLLYMNADVWVLPEWMERLVWRMQEQRRAGVVSPVTLPRYKGPEPSDVPFLDVAAVPGCSMLVRREAWEQVGGFDARFFLTWEDTDLCWRMWLAGWRVLEDLEAHVYHLGRGNWRRWAAEELHNGLFTHLKLMRWRRTLPFAAKSLGRSVVKSVLLRDPSVVGAWRRIARELPELMRERQRWLADGDRTRSLETLVSAQQRRRRRERLEEWHMGREGDS